MGRTVDLPSNVTLRKPAMAWTANAAPGAGSPSFRVWVSPDGSLRYALDSTSYVNGVNTPAVMYKSVDGWATNTTITLPVLDESGSTSFAYDTRTLAVSDDGQCITMFGYGGIGGVTVIKRCVTTDGGANWTVTTIDVEQFFCMSPSGQYQTACQYGLEGSILVSDDYGATWDEVEFNGAWSYGGYLAPISDDGQRIAVHQLFDPNLGPQDLKVAVTANGGATWSVVTVVENCYFGSTPQIVMSRDGKTIAVGMGASTTNLVYMSNDYGATWRHVDLYTAFNSEGGWGGGTKNFAMDSTGRVIVVEDAAGVAFAISTDAGVTWQNNLMHPVPATYGACNNLAMTAGGEELDYAPYDTGVVVLTGRAGLTAIFGADLTLSGIGGGVNGKVWRIAQTRTISATGDPGVPGEICWDDNYLYVRNSTGWMKVPLVSI